MKAFILSNQLALVTEYSLSPDVPSKILEYTNNVLFKGDIKVHNLFFASKKADATKEQLAQFTEAARAFKGKSMSIFVMMDTDVAENLQAMEFFGLKAADAPTIRLIKFGNVMEKYMPDFNDITTSAIVAFVESVFDGSLTPLPEIENVNKKIIAGPGFKQKLPEVTTLTTTDQLKSFQEDNHVAVIGCFKNLESDAAKAFNTVVETSASLFFNNVVFGITSEQKLFVELKLTGNFYC